MASSSDTPFRAIIVGGGVTGFVLASCLSKADIDFVIVERGKEAAPAVGASLMVYPQGARILEQIGVLEAAQKSTGPLDKFATLRPDGSKVMEVDLWRLVREKYQALVEPHALRKADFESHGSDLLVLERREYLQMLYDAIPDKSRVLFNKKVTNIREQPGSVTVTLEDGSTETGDIVIGCDGVHSFARHKMWEAASRQVPGLITTAEKTAIQATWMCLVGMGPGEPALGNEAWAVHNDKYSLLFTSQPHRTFWFVWYKVDKPRSHYARSKYTDADAEAAAAKLFDHPVNDTMVFADIWNKRWRAHLINIEEGVLENWHFGRTVLVGDSCHKVTPNIALGGNTGMCDAAQLTNGLHRLLQAHPRWKPTKAALTQVFEEYQNGRKPQAKHVMEFSNTMSRLQALDGLYHKTMALHVLPLLPASYLPAELAQITKKAPKLDFVPLKPYKARKYLWDDEKDAVDSMTVVSTKMAGKSAGMAQWQRASWVAACVGLSWLILWAEAVPKLSLLSAGLQFKS